jgi:hypothetical protein
MSLKVEKKSYFLLRYNDGTVMGKNIYPFQNGKIGKKIRSN